VTQNPIQHEASKALLTAAMAGLMGLGASACGTKEKIVTVAAASAPAVVTSTVVDKTLSLAKFNLDCKSRGGLVQTHASCAGANTCAGVSYHSSSGKLSEHTCKAANICAGMSCVDLPEDGGLTGAKILEGFDSGTMVGSETQCSFCHGEGKESFTLPIAPDADEAAVLAAFAAKSEAALLGIIAFGVHGINSDGTAFANMPGFYQSYSRAEMERLVTHLRSLPVVASRWTAPK